MPEQPSKITINLTSKLSRQGLMDINGGFLEAGHCYPDRRDGSANGTKRTCDRRARASPLGAALADATLQAGLNYKRVVKRRKVFPTPARRKGALPEVPVVPWDERWRHQNQSAQVPEAASMPCDCRFSAAASCALMLGTSASPRRGQVGSSKWQRCQMEPCRQRTFVEP
jgi:hypothetical protein